MKIELQNQMAIIIKENISLNEMVRDGEVAKERLKKNERKMQDLTRVYTDSTSDIQVEVRQLKHHIAGNMEDEIVETIGKIEDLLGGRTNDNK